MCGDWTKNDVKAALVRAGTCLSRVAINAGFHRSSGSIALKRRWPKMEQAIAAAIGRKPNEIWPRGKRQRVADHATGDRHAENW